MRKPKLLSPGGIYRYTIDLWQVRMRIAAASASGRGRVPAILAQPKLNTGDHNETETEFVSAVHRIYHDHERSSYIEMTVIE